MLSKRFNLVLKKVASNGMKRAICKGTVENSLRSLTRKSKMMRYFSGSRPDLNKDIFQKNKKKVENAENQERLNQEFEQEMPQQEEKMTFMEHVTNLAAFIMVSFSVWLYFNTENVDISENQTFKVLASKEVFLNFFIHFLD